MGYKPGKKLINLEFEEYPGLEVTATSCSIGELLEVSSMPIQVKQNNEAEVRRTFAFFASRLISWNIEHPEIDETNQITGKRLITCPRCELTEGSPLPPTIDGLFCLDFDFVISILMGWMQGVARVSLPKGMNSSNGGINTETLMKKLGELQNPSTLPMPNLS